MAQRVFSTVSTTDLVAFLDDTDTSHTKMSEILGVGQSTVSGWIRKGEMPQHVLLCLEGLKRRRKQQIIFGIVSGAPEKINLVRQLANSLPDISFTEVKV